MCIITTSASKLLYYKMKDLVETCSTSSDWETIKSLVSYLEISKNALHRAIMTSNIKHLNLLLSCKEIDVNSKDDNGDTPLHVAAQCKNDEAVKLLLSKNADMTCRNSCGLTPMFVALANENSSMVDIFSEYFNLVPEEYSQYYEIIGRIVMNYGINYLVEQWTDNSTDVDFDFKHLKGVESPLLIAVVTGQYKTVECLIKAGADVNYRKEGYGMSALHIAIKFNRIQILDLLLECNADVNCSYVTNEMVTTPLHLAAANIGRIPTKMLLERGAMANLPVVNDEPYTSALHVAAKCGNIAGCQMLLQYGAKIDQVDKDNATALYLAAEADVVNLLLENKANPNIANKKGDTPLLRISKWMESKSTLECVKNLINHGADADARDGDGCNILHKARNSESILRFFFEEGIGPDVNCADKFGYTPLTSMDSYFCSSFMVLLHQGADANIPNKAENLWSTIPNTYRSLGIVNNNDRPANNLNCPLYAHFAKLKFLGYNVHEELWLKFQELVCISHAFGECDINLIDFETELNHLKTIIICQRPRKNLYDVLLMKQNKVVKLSDNQVFQSLYEKSGNNFENSFPHFGWLLNLQYRRGSQRKKWISKVQDTLKPFVGNFVLDNWNLILRYLTNDDLKRFSKIETVQED